MIVKLRILTRKSIPGFGVMKDLTIQDMLNSCQEKVLFESYYRLGNISFSQDILDELGITGEYTIQKPGSLRHGGMFCGQMVSNSFTVSKEIFNIYKNKKLSEPDGLKRENFIMARASAAKKQRRVGYNTRQGLYFSKSSMKARNQNS